MREKIDIYTVEYEVGAGFNIIVNDDILKELGISGAEVLEKLKDINFGNKITKISQEYFSVIKELAKGGI